MSVAYAVTTDIYTYIHILIYTLQLIQLRLSQATVKCAIQAQTVIINCNILGCLEFLVKTSMTTMLLTQTKPTDDKEGACRFKYKEKVIFLGLYLVKQPECFSDYAHIFAVSQYFIFRVNNT